MIEHTKSECQNDCILAGKKSDPCNPLTGTLSSLDLPEIYKGDHTIIPKPFSTSVLPTAGFTMDRDVTVLEIPYFEVSNESGNTVYIGGESEVL